MKPDAEAVVLSMAPDEYFPVQNGDIHAVYAIKLLFLKHVGRSYLHFPSLPSGVTRALLWLNFSGYVRGRVAVHATTWDGGYITWNLQPSLGQLLDVGTAQPGWVSFDVTAAVQAGRPLALVVKIADENTRGFRIADFTHPYLELTLQGIEVKAEGLSDFTVTQDLLAQGVRYVSLGKLTVTVIAGMGYEVRICYTVDPPDPGFTRNPVFLSLEGTGIWDSVPACPGYLVLPGFSGDPTDPEGETHVYEVRVDLSALGDRASGEVLNFTFHIQARPR